MAEKEKLFVDVYSKYSNDTDAEFPFPIGLDEYEDFAYSFFRLGKEQASTAFGITAMRLQTQKRMYL